MKNTPFFSIIIPTYNRCEIIKLTIDSLIQQTFKNWECIIINDGSTDNTSIEISEYLNLDPKFTLINQPNSERSISRNNGAKKAKGEYFIFLDSDDYFEVSHLATLNQEILKDNRNHSMYFTNGTCIQNNIKEVIFKENVPSDIPIDFFLKNSVVPARVCLENKLFNKYSFDPRAIIVEDTVLWTEILEKETVKYIPISSVIYNLHENNSVNIKKNNAYLKRLLGLKILFFEKSVGRLINKKIKNQQLNRCYYGISEYHYHQNNKLKGIIWIIKSIINFPRINLKYKFVKLLFLIKFAIQSKKKLKINK